MNYQVPPIDIEQLNQISDGDVEFEIEVLQVYTEDVAQRIETIREALNTSNIVQIKKEAHHIKGSSSNVGALQMRNLAIQLEKLNLSQEQGKALETIEAMIVAVEQIDFFINEKLTILNS